MADKIKYSPKTVGSNGPPRKSWTPLEIIKRISPLTLTFSTILLTLREPVRSR